MPHPAPPPEIFDRAALRHRRARAAHRPVTFLLDAIIADIVDRLETIQRKFHQAAIIGPGASLLRHALTPACQVTNLLELHPLITTAKASEADLVLIGDEQALPILANRLNLMIAPSGLHNLNDLPGALIQMRRSLKPDGLFLGAMPGENTLVELKTALRDAEAEILGGVSPHIAPMAAIKDLGALLQRAGFALPVADKFSIPVTYRDPLTLLADLRAMGETNILLARRKTTLRRDILTRAMEIYQQRFAVKGGVRASFEIIMLTGWAPHQSQQIPLKPGSAQQSMQQAFKHTQKKRP